MGAGDTVQETPTALQRPAPTAFEKAKARKRGIMKTGKEAAGCTSPGRRQRGTRLRQSRGGTRRCSGLLGLGVVLQISFLTSYVCP